MSAGSIDEAELRRICRQGGVEDRLVSQLLQHLDMNGDGIVPYHEFVRQLTTKPSPPSTSKRPNQPRRRSTERSAAEMAQIKVKNEIRERVERKYSKMVDLFVSMDKVLNHTPQPEREAPHRGTRSERVRVAEEDRSREQERGTFVVHLVQPLS